MVLRIISFMTILAFLVFSACSSGNKDGQEKSKSKQEKADKSGNEDSGLAGVKDDESQKNILQVTMASDAHKTLAKAVEAAGLANTLSNPGPFTAFAPTDEAFNKVPDDALESLMKPENKKKLSDILERHVAPVSYDQEQLKKMAENNETLFMANGDYLPINTNDNGAVMLKDAKVLKSIKTTNGMIHVVDKVVLPEK